MDKKMIALLGAVLLIVGSFLPIANLPILGSINLTMPGGSVGDGVFVIALAVIAAVLALMGKVRHVIWPGLCALAFVIWKYLQVKSALDTALAPYGDQLNDTVQMNWLGWGVLLVGALVVIVAGITSWKSAPPAGPSV